MIIKVTEQDIERGSRVFSDHCPVALAINRATGRHAIVYHHAIKIGELSRIEYPVPDKVREFIQDFDSGKEVQPFEFDLELRDDN